MTCLEEETKHDEKEGEEEQRKETGAANAGRFEVPNTPCKTS
jgi:hypothetical protein